MRCQKCRHITEYFLAKDKRIRCKLCKALAPASLKAQRCKHRFIDPKTALFTKNCNRGCGIFVDVSEEEAQQFENMRQQIEQAAKAANEVAAKVQSSGEDDINLELEVDSLIKKE